MVIDLQELINIIFRILNFLIFATLAYYIYIKYVKITIKKAIEKQNTEKKALIEELNDIKRNQIIHKEELANQKREAIQLKLNILKWRTKVDNQQDKIMEENILMTQQMSNRLKKQQEYLTLNQARRIILPHALEQTESDLINLFQNTPSGNKLLDNLIEHMKKF
ncbi:MAG TPA: hypothetical protein VJ201_05250 [Candidatus Babeliales bacterium]|nr:hypothetical protein [Candidatus Babeliales bacterium]